MVSQGEGTGNSTTARAMERALLGGWSAVSSKAEKPGECRTEAVPGCGSAEVTGGRLVQVAPVVWWGKKRRRGDGRVQTGRSDHRSVFPSGVFGERLPLRYYLTAGLLLSGLFTALFGLAYFWNIHELWYFVLVQV